MVAVAAGVRLRRDVAGGPAGGTVGLAVALTVRLPIDLSVALAVRLRVRLPCRRSPESPESPGRPDRPSASQAWRESAGRGRSSCRLILLPRARRTLPLHYCPACRCSLAVGAVGGDCTRHRLPAARRGVTVASGRSSARRGARRNLRDIQPGSRRRIGRREILRCRRRRLSGHVVALALRAEGRRDRRRPRLGARGSHRRVRAGNARRSREPGARRRAPCPGGDARASSRCASRPPRRRLPRPPR